MLATNAAFTTVLLLSFWTVLVAELVGDKSLYALTSLSLRYRWTVVFAAFAIAVAIKMLIAVQLGYLIVGFHGHSRYISGVAFFASAILIWVEEPSHVTGQPWSKGALACFSSFFFTEWGDPGQIAAAAIVLKSHLFLATWLGATLAVLVKGAAALGIGLQIRDHLPLRALRIVASVSCCILGMLAIGSGFSAAA